MLVWVIVMHTGSKVRLSLRVFDACERLMAAKEVRTAQLAISQEFGEFGLGHVTIGTVPKPGDSLESTVLMNTRPESYVEHYYKQGYLLTDPAITELKFTSDMYSWSDVRERRGTLLPKSRLRIMDEVREWGITDGLTIPVYSGGQMSLICPCGEAPLLTKEFRPAIELIAMTGHQALLRATRSEAEKDELRELEQRPVLTPREREVLQLVLIGKSDDEIGDILKISARTAERHVQNAMLKLHTFKRTAAVAEALRRGEINL